MGRIRYKNLSRNSSVLEYSSTSSTITIKFKGVGYGKKGKINTYFYSGEKSTSMTNINEMKQKAKEGKGLNTFINKNKPRYKSAWIE
jgi:hypothetical protein